MRYVLEGSVRKAATVVCGSPPSSSRPRPEHTSGRTALMARWRSIDLQDQVTERVVSAIAPRLEQAEIERARRKPTSSLEAYDYYLQGTAIQPGQPRGRIIER